MLCTILMAHIQVKTSHVTFMYIALFTKHLNSNNQENDIAQFFSYEKNTIPAVKQVLKNNSVIIQLDWKFFIQILCLFSCDIVHWSSSDFTFHSETTETHISEPPEECSGKDLMVFCEPKQFTPGLQLYWASFSRSLPDMAEALAHGGEVNWTNTDDENRTPLIMAVHGVRRICSRPKPLSHMKSDKLV